MLAEDRSIGQFPGFVAIHRPDDASEIDLIRVVATPDGERIEDVDALIRRIEAETRTLEEVGTTTVAGFDAQVVDMTAEPIAAPGPEHTVFSSSDDCDCGWVAPGEARLWVLDLRADCCFSPPRSSNRVARTWRM